jgi:hypothetical protein
MIKERQFYLHESYLYILDLACRDSDRRKIETCNCSLQSPDGECRFHQDYSPTERVTKYEDLVFNAEAAWTLKYIKYPRPTLKASVDFATYPRTFKACQLRMIVYIHAQLQIFQDRYQQKIPSQCRQQLT